MTSCRLTRSRMSRLGGYSNLSAAGSRLKRWTERPSDWACVMSDAQNVDLPAPAGPVTRTASVGYDLRQLRGLDGREEERLAPHRCKAISRRGRVWRTPTSACWPEIAVADSAVRDLCPAVRFEVREAVRRRVEAREKKKADAPFGGLELIKLASFDAGIPLNCFEITSDEMECCLITRSPTAGPDGNPTTVDLTLDISLARESSTRSKSRSLRLHSRLHLSIPNAWPLRRRKAVGRDDRYGVSQKVPLLNPIHTG